MENRDGYTPGQSPFLLRWTLRILSDHFGVQLEDWKRLDAQTARGLQILIDGLVPIWTRSDIHFSMPKWRVNIVDHDDKAVEIRHFRVPRVWTDKPV